MLRKHGRHIVDLPPQILWHKLNKIANKNIKVILNNNLATDNKKIYKIKKTKTIIQGVKEKARN